MGDISLLPEDLREREGQTKQPTPSLQNDEAGLKMHIPDAMIDEDVEIIEVDEGDLAAVLSDEPLMTRLTYKLSLWIDQLKGRLSKTQDESPSKAPPQFFKPPKRGLVTSSHPVIETVLPSQMRPVQIKGSPSGPLGEHHPHARARITPQADVPRRVRVIKRVRKPVRVSLISAEDLAVFSIDVTKRKWTLVIFIFLFSSLIVGGYVFISSRIKISEERFTIVQGEVSRIRTEADEKMTQWEQYEDLEGRINLLQKALDSHVMITRLFDFLEKNTLKGVSYKSASWSDSGQLSLNVVAKDFDDAGGQVIVFNQSPAVDRVEASGFAMEQDSESGAVNAVTFQLAINVKKAALIGEGLEPEVNTNESASSTQVSSNTVQ
jgi:hypothetical protein